MSRVLKTVGISPLLDDEIDGTKRVARAQPSIS
jgi:hypothetical protein